MIIAGVRIIRWGGVKISIDSCKELHRTLQFKPDEHKGQTFDLNDSGTTSFTYFRQGFMDESGYCSGGDTWSDPEMGLDLKDYNVVDHYSITLEKFQALDIDGTTILPMSKTTNMSSGYDHEFGTYYREETYEVKMLYLQQHLFLQINH